MVSFHHPCRVAEPARVLVLPGALLTLALAALAPASAMPRPSGPPPPPSEHAALGQPSVVQIPHERYQLANGITVIVHEDHRQPLVVVNIGVQVGSRDDPVGRTGLAHLFEHLMFMGTQRVPTGKFDEWMEREGGWNNASAGEDRTTFFDVGPSHTLPLLLWLEGDRFSSLGPQLTQAKLDAQRAVVHNERRQEYENAPYAQVDLRLPELLFPADHPYHHPVIGSHADLDAASVGEVRAFFDRWYRPANISLVVAGDIEPPKVRSLLERYFGPLRVGATSRRPGAQVQAPRLHGVRRETRGDQITLPMLVMAWLSPRWFAPGDAELDLLATITTTGKDSRLYRSLVYDQQLAQTVRARQYSLALTSFFTIEAVARLGVPLDQLEQAIDLELAKLRSSPPTKAELTRAKNHYETHFVARLQSLERRAALLNMYQAHLDDPGAASSDLARYRRATAATIHDTAARTLDPNARVIVRVVPHDALPTSASQAGSGP